jgi:hypothetical protein
MEGLLGSEIQLLNFFICLHHICKSNKTGGYKRGRQLISVSA